MLFSSNKENKTTQHKQTKNMKNSTDKINSLNIEYAREPWGYVAIFLL